MPIPFSPDIYPRLFLCVLLGGAIGIERELRSKSAGFRTLILICLGAAIFTICSGMLGPASDPTRIAANIVVGIGFVGGGVIFKGDTGVNGITTAATIWITAAIGMLIGAGAFLLAISATVIVVVVLFLFTYLELWMDKLNRTRVYRLQYPYIMYQNRSMARLLKEYRLKLKMENYKKEGELMTGTWRVQGTEGNHQRFINHMLEDLQIKDFEF